MSYTEYLKKLPPIYEFIYEKKITKMRDYDKITWSLGQVLTGICKDIRLVEQEKKKCR